MVSFRQLFAESGLGQDKTSVWIRVKKSSSRQRELYATRLAVLSMFMPDS